MSQTTSEKSYQVLISNENRSTSELRSISQICEQCVVFIDSMLNNIEAFTTHDGDVEKLRDSSIGGCHMCEMILDRCHPGQDDFHIERTGKADGALYMDVRDSKYWRRALSFRRQHYGLDQPGQTSLRAEDGMGSRWHSMLARNWLSSCQRLHYRCEGHIKSTVRPSRLLVLNSSDDTISLRLVIIYEHTEILSGYCTLSHCWGGEQPLQLTTRTLAAFQTCIPFNILPKTFADAVQITLNLGISYLWIDSLCICQDDEKDWLTESVKMGEIYRNGICNIAALAAKSDLEGCFSKGPTSASETLYFSTGGKHYMTSKLSRFETRDDRLNNTPLGKRGWVFQELALSRRTLYYDAECMSWDCIEYEADEVQVMKKRLPYSRSAPSYKSAFASLYSNISVDEKTWHGVVSEYTSTSLTYDSDKWLAVSGLASRYTERTGSLLVAGLHHDQILQELTWWSQAPAGRVSNGAPTWSWLSSRSKIGLHAVESDKLFASVVALPDKQMSSCTWHIIYDASESTGSSSQLRRYPLTISGHIRPFRYISQEGRFQESFGVEFQSYSMNAESKRVWLDIPLEDGTTIWGVLHSFRFPWDPSLDMILIVPASQGEF